MIDNIPPIPGAFLFVIVSIVALYFGVILPGYEEDRLKKLADEVDTPVEAR